MDKKDTFTRQELINALDAAWAEIQNRALAGTVNAHDSACAQSGITTVAKRLGVISEFVEMAAGARE